MAKHYLDPKQTEGPHDVDVYRDPKASDLNGWHWRLLVPPFGSCWGVDCYFFTEAEALTAARKAAGYETEE